MGRGHCVRVIAHFDVGGSLSCILGGEPGMSWWCGPDGAQWGVLMVVMGRLRGERACLVVVQRGELSIIHRRCLGIVAVMLMWLTVPGCRMA